MADKGKCSSNIDSDLARALDCSCEVCQMPGDVSSEVLKQQSARRVDTWLRKNRIYQDGCMECKKNRTSSTSHHALDGSKNKNLGTVFLYPEDLSTLIEMELKCLKCDEPIEKYHQLMDQQFRARFTQIT